MVQFSGPTIDFAAHFPHVAGRFSGFTRFDWVLDNLNTHYHLELCEAVAALSDLPFEPKKLRTSRERRAFLSDPSHEHLFHFTPTHGSRINQVELWFSVLARQFLARGNFSGPADFAARLERYLGEYNRRKAHPYRWTYAGEPLVRGTPFEQTRRQEQEGRAWVGAHRPLWQRMIYPPRPYKRTR